MSTIPAWIQILQALLTPAIAVAVGAIGFLQWRTAHQKVVLDLFERRLAVIEAARDAAKKVVVDREPDIEAASVIATDALIRCRFLFGSDVLRQLAEFRGDIYRATKWGGVLDSTSDVARLNKARDAARTLLRDLNTLAEPYMRMDQKLIRTPAQWFHDRNKIRLSYSDQK